MLLLGALAAPADTVSVVDVAKMLCLVFAWHAKAAVTHPLDEASILCDWARSCVAEERRQQQNGDAADSAGAPGVALDMAETAMLFGLSVSADGATAQPSRHPLAAVSAENAVQAMCELLGHAQPDWSARLRGRLQLRIGAGPSLAFKRRHAYLQQFPLRLLTRRSSAFEAAAGFQLGDDEALDHITTAAAVTSAASDVGWASLDDAPVALAKHLQHDSAAALAARPAHVAFANTPMCSSATGAVAARYLGCSFAATEAAQAQARRSQEEGAPDVGAEGPTFYDGMVDVTVKAIEDRSVPMGAITPRSVASFFRDACRVVAHNGGDAGAAAVSGPFFASPWTDEAWLQTHFCAPTRDAPIAKDRFIDVLVDPMPPTTKASDGKAGSSKPHAGLAALARTGPNTPDTLLRFTAPALAQLTTALRIREKVEGHRRQASGSSPISDTSDTATPALVGGRITVALPVECIAERTRANFVQAGSAFGMHAVAGALADDRVQPLQSLVMGRATGTASSERYELDAARRQLPALRQLRTKAITDAGALRALLEQWCVAEAGQEGGAATATSPAAAAAAFGSGGGRSSRRLLLARRSLVSVLSRAEEVSRLAGRWLAVARTGANEAASVPGTEPTSRREELLRAIRDGLQEQRLVGESIQDTATSALTAATLLAVRDRAVRSSAADAAVLAGAFVAEEDPLSPTTRATFDALHTTLKDEIAAQTVALAELEERIVQRHAFNERAGASKASIDIVAEELRTEAERAVSLAERDLAERMSEYQRSVDAAADRAGRALGAFAEAALEPVRELERELESLGDPERAARRKASALAARRDELAKQQRDARMRDAVNEHSLIGKWASPRGK
jgi:hypothetical protein